MAGTFNERASRSSLKLPKLRTIDMEAIAKQCDGILEISRGHESVDLVDYGGSSIRLRTIGSDANAMKLGNRKMQAGTFFTEDDVRRRERVAALGSVTAKKLFGAEDPINKTIRVNNMPFTVVGVIQKMDIAEGPRDPNDIMYIPFTVGDKYFRRPELGDGDLDFILIKADEKHSADGSTMRQMKRTLRLMHALDAHDADDFTIFDQKTIMEVAQKASTVIKLFGLIAASISLIVGGIGVMNIMLVSVQERTREIGIRLALGATQRLIQLQFLVEAGTLSAFGGLLGIVVGFFLQILMARATNLPGMIEFLPMLISFLVTICIGIFFGYYPARKASLLNPVEALLNK